MNRRARRDREATERAARYGFGEESTEATREARRLARAMQYRGSRKAASARRKMNREHEMVVLVTRVRTADKIELFIARMMRNPFLAPPEPSVNVNSVFFDPIVPTRIVVNMTVQPPPIRVLTFTIDEDPAASPQE